MTVIRLVADVGGTNSRLAWAVDGEVQAGSVQSYRNSAFDGFGDVVARFCAQHSGVCPKEIVIAIAGPVGAGVARLTNLDWVIDQADLSLRFDGAAVVLVNDLMALGFAVPHLGQGQVRSICDRPAREGGFGQSLVVGVGTGFNVSLVVRAQGGVVCTGAEIGHAAIALDVRRALDAQFGTAAASMETWEDCFSGRGYQALKMAFGGRDDAEFDGVYAGLLGQLARNLVLTFMPLGGLYFAGGVARGVLTSSAAFFRGSYEAQSDAPVALDAPVHVITDDAAALQGGARMAVAAV